MNSATRIGAADADVILLAKGGRDFRVERIGRGEETPREFFYGFYDLNAAGITTAMMSSEGAVSSRAGALCDFAERGFAALTALGVKPLTARLARKGFAGSKVLISFTDGFSLSMGLGYGSARNRPALIGGFHGLSDIEPRAPLPARRLVRGLIGRALAGLDHVFFFGPADRELALSRYDLSEDRSSVIPFGVDTAFWRPLADAKRKDFVIAVGQDGNRDFNLLARAPGRHPTRIVTRRPVNVPADAEHVTVAAGDFFDSTSLTDEGIRALYNMAAAVVVPLKDVNQPTGYSVTLQAMSCGRPVILSRIRGLWAPELLVDGQNCLLVPPGDATALGEAIGRVRADPALAARLGAAARETVAKHFGLETLSAAAISLAQRGFEIYRRRAGG